MTNFLIYGANGYTGELITQEAQARGLRPILAGRNAPALSALARELNLEHRVFALDRPEEVNAGLEGMTAVLHCAGPFTHTFRPMAEACLRQGVHYLDITGEAGVFETLAGWDEQARNAGVMLMPGVGFDVVPSDCLAAHLKRRLPSATRLVLGFQNFGRPSRGTATTAIEKFGVGGLARRGGRLIEVPTAWKTRRIDFGAGPTLAMTIPWGDVVTAYHSTSIPNIEVYMAAPLGVRVAARLSRFFGWLLRSGPVQRFLRKKIREGPPGPTQEQRARGKALLWGEAVDASGQRVVSRLNGPEGYTFTVWTALAVVRRVLAGDAPVGFQTPAKAYGPDFVLGLEGAGGNDSRLCWQD